MYMHVIQCSPLVEQGMCAVDANYLSALRISDAQHWYALTYMIKVHNLKNVGQG